VRDYAIELSIRLKRYGGRFVLGRRRYIPHISLYHIPVSTEDFESFCDQVQNIARRFSRGELRLRAIELPLLITDKPEWLKKLHLNLIKKTSTYFDFDYGAEKSWSTDRLPTKLRVRAKGYLQKYGSPLIGSAFRPHITLTSFEDNAVINKIPPLWFQPMSFHVDTIHLCELGPSHSCQRIVEKFGAW
jgi:hypothetical protein